MVPASVASSVRVHSLVHYVHRVTSRCESSCCERVYLIRAELVCHSRFKRAGITHSWHTVRVIAEGGCHCELLVGNEPAINTQNITGTICMFGLLTTVRTNLVNGITFQHFITGSLKFGARHLGNPATICFSVSLTAQQLSHNTNSSPWFGLKTTWIFMWDWSKARRHPCPVNSMCKCDIQPKTWCCNKNNVSLFQVFHCSLYAQKSYRKIFVAANFAKEGKNKRYHGNKNLTLSEHNHEFDTKQVFCTLIMWRNQIKITDKGTENLCLVHEVFNNVPFLLICLLSASQHYFC